MLSPYRVLDLTDERGELAAMLLGDLGADVIRVEPPEGSDARRAGPKDASAPDHEQSLQFYAFNRNKRSIAIDLQTDRGRDEFLQLVATADFVIESAPGSLLAAAGIDFETLKATQPHIVHLQITAYGCDGPRADWPASDLTLAAMGGPVSLQGVPERAPVRISVPQVWRHAGAEAAVAALTAHAQMRRTGKAQFVDVSAQAAMTWTMLNGMGAAAIQGHDFERAGSLLQLGPFTYPLVFPCADGHVVIIPNGELFESLLDWMIKDGVASAALKEFNWKAYEMLIMSGGELALQPEEMREVLRSFLSLHTKRELFEHGLEIDATIAPVNTVADLVDFPHLKTRDFWQHVQLPGGSECETPGAFVKTTLGPLAIDRRPPTFDQHGDEIRAELKVGEAREPRVAEADLQPDGDLPFAGLKVADFSWIGVGPISAKYLADHGATVVRVESTTHPDKLRLVAPVRDEMGIDKSHFFADMNASKLGLTLNLKTPGGIEVAKRLIGWSDVLLESFTPGSLDKLGIGYETARELNPKIIMLSTCLMGQTGPAASMAGYGYHAGAVAGFYELTGWPDLAPAGPWMAYTDTVAPRFVATTVMAAIDHLRRTGEGQHIDGAQFEMGLHFLAPEILDYQLNGHLASRAGNRAPDAAPHGVYPCVGEDQWCAIAITSDDEWKQLGRALGNPSWASDPTLDNVEQRLARQDELDQHLAAWTTTRSPAEVTEHLVKHQVPAGAVQRSSDLLNDSQYTHRNFYRYHDHAEIGNSPYAGHQFRIRDYDSGPRFAAPTIGQHSFEVMTELLGISDDEIGELYAQGAIE
ncbi:MAG: crotonobetainyl-CoA:carnitine CoA-transferase CaiB-like acyl-CoA transferase [Myxococcota bacterium]|jgi:crotonobetainyl-CoA:carnitine CoA-transferase CaiB-like acyl-CoA transferase